MLTRGLTRNFIKNFSSMILFNFQSTDVSILRFSKKNASNIQPSPSTQLNLKLWEEYSIKTRSLCKKFSISLTTFSNDPCFPT